MKRVLIAAAVLLGMAVIVVGTGGLSAWQSHKYATTAASLKDLWSTDERQGIPASDFSSWRTQVAAWEQRWQFAPAWLWANGQGQLADLRRQTDALYRKTEATDKATASASLMALQEFVAVNKPWLTVKDAAALSDDRASVASANSPAALTAINAQITATQKSLTSKVAQIQTSLSADIANRGGAGGVLNAAARDIATAQADNLDTGDVPALLANAQAQGVGDQPTQADVTLDQGLNQLEARITVNNQIASSLLTQTWNLDAAQAEATPNASSLQAQLATVQSAFKAAQTDDQLAAVSGQITAFQSAVNADTDATKCGHNVGSGKVITISLSLQEAIFYQDGCVAKATPVTTGRPALPTPTGTFHVFYKTTPFQMISPWPQSSPYYYNPTWVTWVMEFAGGGYFLHDASWESTSEYGPGGEFTGGASHGCVHIPTSTMEWAYSWTPVGTPVVITG